MTSEQLKEAKNIAEQQEKVSNELKNILFCQTNYCNEAINSQVYIWIPLNYQDKEPISVDSKDLSIFLNKQKIKKERELSELIKKLEEL